MDPMHLRVAMSCMPSFDVLTWVEVEAEKARPRGQRSTAEAAAIVNRGSTIEIWFLNTKCSSRSSQRNDLFLTCYHVVNELRLSDSVIIWRASSA